MKILAFQIYLFIYLFSFKLNKQTNKQTLDLLSSFKTHVEKIKDDIIKTLILGAIVF